MKHNKTQWLMCFLRLAWLPHVGVGASVAANSRIRASDTLLLSVARNLQNYDFRVASRSLTFI